MGFAIVLFDASWLTKWSDEAKLHEENSFLPKRADWSVVNDDVHDDVNDGVNNDVDSQEQHGNIRSVQRAAEEKELAQEEKSSRRETAEKKQKRTQEEAKEAAAAVDVLESPNTKQTAATAEAPSVQETAATDAVEEETKTGRRKR